MEALLVCLHIAAYLALGLALPLPRLRRLAVAALLLAAVTGVGHGLSGPAERTLETVHTYAGYEGAAFEVSMVSFPTGTATAPGWQWPLPFAAFAALWIVVLRRLGDRPSPRPIASALAFAWTALAAWLGMQLLAAPAALVQPVGLDRFLFPAGLALAIGAARTSTSLLTLFVTISAGTMAARLPAALFSWYASAAHLGTCLDIHSIVDIVNPMTQMQFEPRLQPGSSQQHFWLIWLEHVIVFPACYLLSYLGVAFGIYMFHHHGPETETAAR
ncbi:MAG: hypothetical protein JNM25_04880 [Planctomycetes bacterium]|nr:hypothetical protein [Planctomycetota bacterium]